jgi:hypothetical protein
MLRRELGRALQQIRGAVEIAMLETSGSLVELLLGITQAGRGCCRTRFLLGAAPFLFQSSPFFFGSPPFFFGSPPFLFGPLSCFVGTPCFFFADALCLAFERRLLFVHRGVNPAEMVERPLIRRIEHEDLLARFDRRLVLAGVERALDVGQMLVDLFRAPLSRVGRHRVRGIGGPAKVGQRFLHRRDGLESPIGIFLERFVHDFHEARIEVGAVLEQRRRRAVQNARQHVVWQLARKCRLMRKELVKHRADREDVGARVHGGASDLFRGHVVQGPQDRPGQRVARGAQLGDAKVEDLYRSLGTDDEVRRLDVPMHDIHFVRVREPRTNFFGQLHLAQDRERRPQADQIGERVAAHELHGDEGQTVVLADVVDRDDIGVTEDAGGAGLAREAVAKLGSIVARPEQLDGDVAADPGISRAVQGTHAALSDQVDDLVPPEGRWNLHKFDSEGDEPTITGRLHGMTSEAGLQ